MNQELYKDLQPRNKYMESVRLEKTFKIIESNCKPDPTVNLTLNFSLSGDSHDPPGRGAVQPALGDPASAGGLDWVIPRGPFQPQTFCDSFCDSTKSTTKP